MRALMHQKGAYVVPAQAGMSPDDVIWLVDPIGGPRAGGDEPAGKGFFGSDDSVVPAQAGMSRD